MKKRLLTVILATVMAVSVISMNVFATEESVQSETPREKVEIKFCVGDDTLLINGQSVIVEKPYVVGEGVTLVPVRVITEAFGAKVDWVAESQTVLLDYPEVKISLQIGNPVAEVNGKAEVLLSAPELPKDTTMVPLRFISETFGATVTYNPENEEITVTKDISENGDATVEGTIENKFVGDSFFGWSMENPVDAVMDYRTFDGSSVSFTYENGSNISVDIYKLDDNFDFDKMFANIKSGYEGNTLSRAEKISSDGNRMSMHFQARNKNMTMVEKIFVVSGYEYNVNGYFYNDDEEIKNKGIAVLETFDVTFEREDIYDLSNTKDGYRKFESEFLKLSFDVPQSFAMYSSENAENNFYFEDEDDETSYIDFSVCSKENGLDAKSVAQRDYEHNKKITNADVVKFAEAVAQKTYGETSGFEYVYEVSSENSNTTVRDFYFEKGKYIYNMTVSFNKDEEDFDKIVDTIISSIQAEELDYDEVGIILELHEEYTGTTTYDDLVKCEFALFNSFDGWIDNQYGSFTDAETQVGVMIQCDASEEYTYSKVKENVKQSENMAKNFDEITVVESTTDKVFGKKKFVSLLMKVTEDGKTGYMQQYATDHKGMAYIVIVGYDEKMYSDYSRGLINDMMNSFVFK